MSTSNPYAPKIIQATSKPPVDAVESVPSGSVSEILDWVGSDTSKAQRALDAEQEGHKRKSLVSKLTELVGPANPPIEPELDLVEKTEADADAAEEEKKSE